MIEKRIIFMNRVKERREFYQKTEILLSFFLDNARNEKMKSSLCSWGLYTQARFIYQIMEFILEFLELLLSETESAQALPQNQSKEIVDRKVEIRMYAKKKLQNMNHKS